MYIVFRESLAGKVKFEHQPERSEGTNSGVSGAENSKQKGKGKDLERGACLFHMRKSNEVRAVGAE